MEAILYGLAFAAIGTLQAVAFAWLRYRRLRFPASSSYPGALLNSIGTAFIDEAAFRGILLALLLGTGMDPSFANAIQAILYALTTRMGGAGSRPVHADPDPRDRVHERLAHDRDRRHRRGVPRPLDHAVRGLRHDRPPGPDPAARHAIPRTSSAGSGCRPAGASSGTGDAVYGGR